MQMILFLTATEADFSNCHLKDDLSKTNDWGYKWKMSSNPDSTKPPGGLSSDYT